MSDTLTAAQRATLRALCDTIVPRIERADDPTGFWARRASDLGIEQYVEGFLATLPAEQRGGLVQLLDGLAMLEFTMLPSDLSREQILTNVSLSSDAAALGLEAYKQLTLTFFYGAVDPATGQNPNWKQFAFPGPVSAPRDVPKTLPVQSVASDTQLEADVCIVGSGAGGSVIAAELAKRGMRVVILEAGGYYNESDFAQNELKAYQEMYWRQGPQTSADGNFTLLAGRTLGGGTVVNWTNCVRTPQWVRSEWASEYGLTGLDTPEFDAHLDAVLGRIGANGDCSDLNPAQQRVADGCDKLGWSHKRTQRNTDPATYTPETAGYLGFGDHTGSKNSADKNWLRDATDHGAKILVRTKATRVLVENGRAAGVEAVYADPATGASANVTVRAPRVVVAAGALESPSLLLRSGIGGPAAGNYLRLHPCGVVFAVYGDDQRAWWGAPHAMLCDEFSNPGNGYGFLIEGSQYAPSLIGAAVHWTSGRGHKELMADAKRGVTTIGLVRDHGFGRVALDAAGESVVTYDVTDPLDVENYHKGLDAQIQIALAAGASALYLLAPGLPRWRYGDDVDAFRDVARTIEIGFGGSTAFSAHQMGSCRMGSDPATSVADPFGELHDVKGVYVGDASAFPTPSGANPMVTTMALAHRTAAHIARAAHAGNGNGATRAPAMAGSAAGISVRP